MLSNPRAVRYELRVPVRYRAPGQEHWTEGITANVSPSGVLITGDLPAAGAETIAVVIDLPDSKGCLTGCGRIARVPSVAAPGEPGTFAVAVSKFSIEHQPAARTHDHGLHREC